MAERIEYKLKTWAQAIGVQERTLAVRLSRAGVSFGSHDLIAAKDIFNSNNDDKERATIDKLEAQTESIRQKNQVKNGELIELPTAEREIWTNLLGPLRQELDLMPGKLAAKVAPDSIKAAQKIIFDYVEDVKKKLLKEKKK